MNNGIFVETMENLRKIRNIKLVAIENRTNNLVTDYHTKLPNYHIMKFFTETLLSKELKKNQIYMNKPAYLGLPVIEFSKIVMCEFWYGEKENCAMCIYCIHKNR